MSKAMGLNDEMQSVLRSGDGYNLRLDGLV